MAVDSRPSTSDCPRCGGMGWRRVTRADGATAVIECECRRVGDFEAIGESGDRVIESLRSGNSSTAQLSDNLMRPAAEEIGAGEGIKYASARVASLPDRADREIGMLILNRRGKARAISIREICGVFKDLDARRVKAAVETLRVEARVPIAATKEPPYGYFIPTTADECRECHDRLLREGVKLILLSQLFGRDADLVRELEGQLRLERESRKSKVENGEGQ